MATREQAVLVSFLWTSWFCSLWNHKTQVFATRIENSPKHINSNFGFIIFNTRFKRVGSALLPGSQFRESAETPTEYYEKQQHKTAVPLETFIRLVSRHGFLFFVSTYSFLASSFTRTATEHLGMVSWPRSSKILPIRHWNTSVCVK